MPVQPPRSRLSVRGAAPRRRLPGGPGPSEGAGPGRSALGSTSPMTPWPGTCPGTLDAWGGAIESAAPSSVRRKRQFRSGGSGAGRAARGGVGGGRGPGAKPQGLEPAGAESGRAGSRGLPVHPVLSPPSPGGERAQLGRPSPPRGRPRGPDGSASRGSRRGLRAPPPAGGGAKLRKLAAGGGPAIGASSPQVPGARKRGPPGAIAPGRWWTRTTHNDTRSGPETARGRGSTGGGRLSGLGGAGRRGARAHRPPPPLSPACRARRSGDLGLPPGLLSRPAAEWVLWALPRAACCFAVSFKVDVGCRRLELLRGRLQPVTWAGCAAQGLGPTLGVQSVGPSGAAKYFSAGTR